MNPLANHTLAGISGGFDRPELGDIPADNWDLALMLEEIARLQESAALRDQLVQ